jgi:hypothetical protein
MSVQCPVRPKADLDWAICAPLTIKSLNRRPLEKQIESFRNDRKKGKRKHFGIWLRFILLLSFRPPLRRRLFLGETLAYAQCIPVKKWYSIGPIIAATPLLKKNQFPLALEHACQLRLSSLSILLLGCRLFVQSFAPRQGRKLMANAGRKVAFYYHRALNWPTFPVITIPPRQRNREFSKAYQEKFFEEQGICSDGAAGHSSF